MLTLTSDLAESELNFSEQLIHEQIQKIFRYHPFTVSTILRNFLLYIINETISGRSNDIKEYNIAVAVMGKPSGFRTVDSGIVRVHAQRLRRALHSYYRETGEMDSFEISIPTGRYVPVFKRKDLTAVKLYPELKSVGGIPLKEKIKIAVIPFHCLENDIHRMAFADSIGLMLNQGLGSSPNFSLVSYFTTQLIKNKMEGIQTLVATYHLDYVLTGNVHFDGSKIRVNFQFIDARTEMQLYSETSGWHYTSNNYFDLSDLIVKRILTNLGVFCEGKDQPLVKDSMADSFERTAIA